MSGDLEFTIEYDRANPSSIEAYAQRLIGRSFRDVMDEDEAKISKTNY